MIKKFALTEVIVVVSIMAILATILSGLAFSSLSMKKTGEHELSITYFFKNEKDNLVESIEDALIICSFDARVIDGDSPSICENKEGLTNLDSSKKLFFKSKDNEDFILEFKNNNLILTGENSSESKTLAKKVSGSISYYDKNLYKLEIEFLSEKSEDTNNVYPIFIKIPKEY